MKNILDSIMQVEQTLQRNIMDAQKEADEMVLKARQKLDQLDEEYAKEFHDKRKAQIAEIEAEAQEYSEKLMKEMKKNMDAQTANLDKKRNKIVQGIHDLFIKYNQEG